MQLKELKLLFEAGDLTGAAIVPAVMATGYQLQFGRKGKTDAPTTLDAKRTGQARIFQNIDTPARIAKEIGFRLLSVRMF